MERPMQTKSIWKVIDRLTTVAILVVAVALGWKLLRPKNGPIEPPPPKLETTSISDAARIGSPRAPLAMIIYSDFECPFCGQFARDVWPQIQREFVDTGKILVAFKNFPLSIHQNAFRAAEVAECARRQDKFWPVHDAIFAGGVRLERDSILRDASRLVPDPVGLEGCLGETTRLKIQNELTAAMSIGLRKTPSFAIGRVHLDDKVQPRVILEGLLEFDKLASVLDSVK